MKDLMLNSNGDLQITNNDLVIGESDQQHQKLLLIAEPGSIKEFPTVGVGLANFLEGEDDGLMMQTIRNQFDADGMTINSISVDNGKIKIDANYRNS
jgi:hypothetical protein